MEKRNTLLLTVIAVATLLVAVVGATFAYFASGGVSAEGSNIGVGADVTASQATLTASGNSIAITVTPETMRKADGNNTTDVIAGEDSGDVVVSLLSGSTEVTAVCTYDLVWSWDDDSATYEPSEGLTGVHGGKEFTLKLTHDGAANTTSGTPNESVDTVAAEVNVDKLTNDLVLIDNASITNKSADAPTETTWTVDAKIYNLGIDQSGLAGDGADVTSKSYAGKITVANVVC